MINFGTYRSSSHDVRQLSLLWGLLRFKDAVPAPGAPARGTSYEARIVLLWFMSGSVSYTATYGHHLQIEIRIGWIGVDCTLNLYPYLP